VQHSRISTAPEGSEEINDAKEETQRLAAQLERAEQRLAALQAQLTPPAGAPCSVSNSFSST